LIQKYTVPHFVNQLPTRTLKLVIPQSRASESSSVTKAINIKRSERDNYASELDEMRSRVLSRQIESVCLSKGFTMQFSIDRTSITGCMASLLSAAMLIASPLAATAEENNSTVASESAFEKALDAIEEGKLILDANFRWEYAKIDKLQHSHAATVRTRFGFQSKEVFGFTALVEGVNTASPKPSGYFNGVV